MPQLILDFGNTLIKAASFQEQDILASKIYKTTDELIADESFLLAHDNVIISSVTNDHTAFTSKFTQYSTVIHFTSLTPIPIHNYYKTPLTLGPDRLAAAVGANYLYPNQNVLCIDCGTCIKYDFVEANNSYLGGAISPGIVMKSKALNNYTAKLPLIKLTLDPVELVGNTTENSILSGVINGTLAEISDTIHRYQEKYQELITIITGGDADFFVKRLKNSIFTHPEIVLLGLNQILLHNLEKK